MMGRRLKLPWIRIIQAHEKTLLPLQNIAKQSELNAMVQDVKLETL